MNMETVDVDMDTDLGIDMHIDINTDPAKYIFKNRELWRFKLFL
jgi:hypothetical protein